MPSSDQQPSGDENGQQEPAEITHNLDTTGNQEVVPAEGLDPVAYADAIHRGLIYPPPPSYYEKIPLPAVEQPPFTKPAAQSTPAVGRESSAFAHPSQESEPVYRPLQPQWEMPAAPAPSPGLYPPPWAQQIPVQSPQKRSRKWIWIVVSILGVALVVSCGLCSWGVYTLFDAVYQPVVGSITVADDFYSNVQTLNYNAAYADLAPQGAIAGLTLSLFTEQAMQADTQFGPVMSYMPGQPGFTNNSNGPDLSIITLTMSITRTHRSAYNSLLTLQKKNGQWKIIDYDQI